MPSSRAGAVCPAEGERPYLSIVTTARNDNHGGNLLGRMQVFVSAWIEQARRHNLSSELILVEWNPPADRPRLGEALRWPKDMGPTRVRIIEVPGEIHRGYRHADALPLYQMIAKNVGIRRARGEFVLATNIDIVFSDEMVRFLAERRLEKGKLYRADRYDVGADIPVEVTLDEQLAWCRGHVIRLCARHGIFKLTADGMRENLPDDIAPPGSGIWFGEGWFEIERYTIDRFRWMENEADLFVQVPAGGGTLRLEVEAGPGVGPPPHRLEALDEDGKLVAEWLPQGRTTLRLDVPDAAGGRRRIRFRAPDGGRPVMNDPRIMNFRFYRAEWMDPKAPDCEVRPFGETVWRWRRLLGRTLRDRLLAGPLTFVAGGPQLFFRVVKLLRLLGEDIFDAGASFRLCGGWHTLESAGGVGFRWAHDNPGFSVCFPDDTTRLAMLVESGPSLGCAPFDLAVRVAGREVGRARIRGLSYVEFDLPLRPGEETVATLHVENPLGAPGQAIPDETRTLNFKVLACGRATPLARPAVVPAPKPGLWPARTLGTRPPERDWAEELAPQAKAIAEMGRPRFLHTYACGDFQLMAREDWGDVRGYAELDEFSMHVDSLLNYAAHHSGREEVYLAEPIYHIEHGIGSGWTPEGHDALMERIASKGISQLVFSDLAAIAAQMRRLHSPMIFNLDYWGLAGENLPETVI